MKKLLKQLFCKHLFMPNIAKGANAGRVGKAVFIRTVKEKAVFVRPPPSSSPRSSPAPRLEHNSFLNLYYNSNGNINDFKGKCPPGLHKGRLCRKTPAGRSARRTESHRHSLEGDYLDRSCLRSNGLRSAGSSLYPGHVRSE